MDEDLKLVERLTTRAESYRMGGPSSEHTAAMLDEAAITITRLHAEIEALKSDVSDLVRAGSDEATENERLAQLADERAERMGQIAYERDDIAASFSVATNALSDALFENERLVKERDELRLAICEGEDAPGHNASLSHETILKALASTYALQRERAETAEAQRDAALEALRPFAEVGMRYCQPSRADMGDDWLAAAHSFNIGHFRAASRTLEGVKP